MGECKRWFTCSKWLVIDGRMEVVPKTGDIKTKLKFGDCQLHIEFSAPDEVASVSQGRGNSGVFFQDRYELQILDSYQNRTYRNGQAGSIYKDVAPLVNAMRSPLEWNTYDVIYTAPRFKPDGRLDYPARITVLAQWCFGSKQYYDFGSNKLHWLAHVSLKLTAKT